MVHMKDEQLLARAAQGDETAFILLYERYRERIFRFTYRLLGSMEQAEDITHDCFLALIKEPRRYDAGRASLSTFLYAVARNLALKQCRQLGREIFVEEMSAEPLTELAPLATLLDVELSNEVRNAVSNLPPLQREALILYEYEELSLAEVAEIVDADVNTVKARLYRAREQLRRQFAPYFKSRLKVSADERSLL